MDVTDFELELGGRRLAGQQRGPADGPAIISHHGTPGSRLAVPGGWELPDELGIRLITFDRPGYGGSTRAPGRRVADAAADAGAVADHLGIARFAVIGTSGGGPHALATAALLPDRVTRLCVCVGLGPIGEPGFDADAGLPAETAEEGHRARAGEAALRAYIAGYADSDDTFEAWYSKLPPSDREIRARPDVIREEEAEMARSETQGIEGWVDDDLALYARPWGFRAADVSVPTELWYGGADYLIQLSHGEAYAAAMPHAAFHVVPDGGHWLRDSAPRMLRWLAGHDA